MPLWFQTMQLTWDSSKAQKVISLRSIGKQNWVAWVFATLGDQFVSALAVSDLGQSGQASLAFRSHWRNSLCDRPTIAGSHLAYLLIPEKDLIADTLRMKYKLLCVGAARMRLPFLLLDTATPLQMRHFTLWPFCFHTLGAWGFLLN